MGKDSGCRNSICSSSSENSERFGICFDIRFSFDDIDDFETDSGTFGTGNFRAFGDFRFIGIFILISSISAVPLSIFCISISLIFLNSGCVFAFLDRDDELFKYAIVASTWLQTSSNDPGSKFQTNILVSNIIIVVQT